MTTTSRVDERSEPAGRDAPTRSYATQVACVLTAAFALSLAYTIYTTAAGLTPSGMNATSPAAWVFYAIGFGAAALARRDRRGAWFAIAGLLTVLLAVGVFAYPSTFTAKLQTPIGWFENDVYIGLLLLALYLSTQRLRGLTLAPRPSTD